MPVFLDLGPSPQLRIGGCGKAAREPARPCRMEHLEIHKGRALYFARPSLHSWAASPRVKQELFTEYADYSNCFLNCSNCSLSFWTSAARSSTLCSRLDRRDALTGCARSLSASARVSHS